MHRAGRVQVDAHGRIRPFVGLHLEVGLQCRLGHGIAAPVGDRRMAVALSHQDHGGRGGGKQGAATAVDRGGNGGVDPEQA